MTWHTPPYLLNGRFFFHAGNNEMWIVWSETQTTLAIAFGVMLTWSQSIHSRVVSLLFGGGKMRNNCSELPQYVSLSVALIAVSFAASRMKWSTLSNDGSCCECAFTISTGRISHCVRAHRTKQDYVNVWSNGGRQTHEKKTPHSRQ